jgi:hypothetical protein
MNLRSVLAVVAGMFIVVALTTLVDMALHAAHVYPPANQPIDDSLALLATSYRVVIGIAGAWVTARLSPRKPLKHAVALGIVGTVLGIAGVVATWNLGVGPRWYAIALAVLAIPQSWAGGKLYEMGFTKITDAESPGEGPR